MDHMRNWIKGAKNSIPLPLSLVGDRVENRAENSWNQSSDQRQRLQINIWKTMKDNEQTRRMLSTKREHSTHQSFPLFLWFVQFCVNRTWSSLVGLQTDYSYFLIWSFWFCLRSCFSLKKKINRKAYKFPQ